MSRLINEDELVRILQVMQSTETMSYGRKIYGRVMQQVKDLSTIDAEPIRHGMWIIRDNPGTGWYRITCSECGADVTSTAPCIGFLPNAKVNWDYCPDCGAKMLDTLYEVKEW